MNVARSENMVVWNVIVRSTTNSVTAQHPLQNTLGACSSASAVPFRPRLATTHSILIWRGFSLFLFCMVVAGEVGFLQRRNWRNSSANSVDEVLAKLFFGERICQNFGSFVFEFGCRKWKRRGLGRNFPFAPLISFGEIRAGNSKKELTIFVWLNGRYFIY